MITKTKDFKEYCGDDEVVHAKDIKRLYEDRKYTFRVHSKLPTLDNYIHGFVPGELIVVSGFTKHGKTLFCQTLTHNFEEQDCLSIWFSFELPPIQFLDCFPDLPFLYMPKTLKQKNIEWIENRIIESYQKFHTRTVFIDHLHYVVDIAKKGNASLDIGAVIRRLKSLAVAEGFIIFLLCHTTNDRGDDRDFGSPRDSSFIEQESDTALMIKRFPKIGDNISAVQINQHRRTGIMDKRVWMEKIGSYLVETTEREIPEQEKKRKRSYYGYED